MATYASATNPFLKAASDSCEQTKRPNESNASTDAKQQQQKRNAPGMARPQASRRDKKRAAKRREKAEQEVATSSDEPNLLLGLEHEPEAERQNGTRDANIQSLELDENNNSVELAADLLESVDLNESNDNNTLVEKQAITETCQISDQIQGDHETSEDKEEEEDKQEEDEEVLEEDENREEPMELVDQRRHQHLELIRKLRFQLRDLERYAYERGELEQAPASVLAERQSVILETLKRKLPLNLDTDKIERLELEELKSQVDKEISELLDPLITKDHLLNQLKTQLTDLERYISHLHKTLGLGSGGTTRTSQDPDCSCSVHGCASPRLTSSITFQSLAEQQQDNQQQNVLSDETLPKTSRLIRGLMAQLICSDIKIQEAMKRQKDYSKCATSQQAAAANSNGDSSPSDNKTIVTKAPQFHDSAVWTMHIDRVVLATDSLTNLYAIDQQPKAITLSGGSKQQQVAIDESLVDSVVRRQLVPALRDLLAYGLIDPNSTTTNSTASSFVGSFLPFDPYYLISSLTCLPGTQQSSPSDSGLPAGGGDKLHVWQVIEGYFKARNEIEFSRSSSVKTLSQSFNLIPSTNGPLKVTSRQALLIAVDDIRERLSRCKPNGPESHLKLFIYTALNQTKLATWVRLIFRNKSILKQYYHPFSFVSQQEKMDKLLAVIEVLSQIEFKLNTDTDGSVDQFVSAF